MQGLDNLLNPSANFGRAVNGASSSPFTSPFTDSFPSVMTSLFANRFINRVLHKTLLAVLLPACLLWSVAQSIGQSDGRSDATSPVKTMTSTELPTHWNGAPLRPLALSEVEHRFARRFPGSIARMTDGELVLVLRTVRQPTRLLHPAADCYKGLGYRIGDERLEQVERVEQLDGASAHAPIHAPTHAFTTQPLQRCFTAERAGRRVRVCEHIEDAKGNTFTDTSAWYWAAVAGQSTGPWQAITVARAL